MEGKTMKKNYMQPTILVVRIQHSGVTCITQVSTTRLDSSLNYDASGGDQGSAWTKETSDVNLWDNEW